jgi:hypothetical protein
VLLLQATDGQDFQDVPAEATDRTGDKDGCRDGRQGGGNVLKPAKKTLPDQRLTNAIPAEAFQQHRSCPGSGFAALQYAVMEEMLSFLRAAAVLSTLFLGGCAASIAYRAAYVPDGPISPVDHVKGRVLIFTTLTDDNRSIVPGATSVTAFKMNVQAGVMARQIAITVFSRVADGADESHDLANAGRYAIVLRPQIENIDYGFTHPKRLGIEVTPQVRVVMRITLLDPIGRVLLEKDYDSGPVSKGRSIVSEKLVERTDVLVHEAIYDVMLRAAGDVRLFQQTQAAAAKANQTSDR